MNEIDKKIMESFHKKMGEIDQIIEEKFTQKKLDEIISNIIYGRIQLYVIKVAQSFIENHVKDELISFRDEIISIKDIKSIVKVELKRAVYREDFLQYLRFDIGKEMREAIEEFIDTDNYKVNL